MSACVHVCDCMSCMCMFWRRQEEGVRFLGARVTGSCDGHWELSSGLLEEQAVLLNTELPLQLKPTPTIILEFRLLWM